MINIIDRYISRIFLLYFLAGLTVFVTLFIAVDFMSYIVKYAVPFPIVIKYFLYQIPLTIYQMIPMACLIGTVFTLSTLNKTSELVALYSSGLSLARICAPMLVFVCLISAFSFWLSDQVVPKFTQKKNYVFYVEIKQTPGLYSTVKTNKIWYRSENILFNIQTLNAKDKKAQGINLYYFNPQWDLIQFLEADEVQLDKRNWTLKNGKVTLFETEGLYPLTKSFDTKNIIMNEDITDIQQSPTMSNSLSVKQLRKFIRKNKDAGLDTVNYEVDFHGKFSYAFAAFVMALMGIPFSVKRQRSGGTMANAGMCFGLTFLYWALYSSSITMGRYGVLPPIFAAWVANILVTGGSLALLVRLNR